MAKLKEVCIINPKSPGFPDDLKVSFVPMPKVGENGEFNPSDVKEYREVKKGFTYFQNGDVLFAKITPCMENGKGAIANGMKNGVGFGSTEFHVLRPLTDYVSDKWLFYLLSWPIFRKDAEKNMTGSAGQKRVPKSFLEEYALTIPSIEEQQKMTDALDKVSNLISLRKGQLAKLDELVKARFVELFGDPVSNPMGWKKEQLQSNATLLNGRAYKQDELLDSGKYPVLRVGNFFSNRSWYYSDLELDDDKYCDNGDLLYAWSASFGPRIWSGGKVIYHYHIWKVLVGENYNKQFLCNLLDYVTASLMGDTHGIGMMHLTKSGMEETEFIVPPIDLQNQFATFVEQTVKSKLAIQQSLDKLETLKKSLMQKCFG